MSKFARIFAVAALAAGLGLAVGCGGSDGEAGGSGGPVTRADSPEQAVRNMVGALEQGNRAQFMANVYAGEGGEQFANGFYSMLHGMIALQNDMVRVYGEEATERLDLDFPTSADLDEMQVTQQDESSAKVTLAGDEMPVIKRDGHWMVDLTELTDGAPQGEMFAQMTDAMTQAINETRAKVGQPDYTPERIEAELEQAMQQAMAPMMEQMMQEAMREMMENAGEAGDGGQ